MVKILSNQTGDLCKVCLRASKIEALPTSPKPNASTNRHRRARRLQRVPEPTKPDLRRHSTPHGCVVSCFLVVLFGFPIKNAEKRDAQVILGVNAKAKPRLLADPSASSLAGTRKCLAPAPACKRAECLAIAKDSGWCLDLHL